ncbi:MAG: serine/threonine-protein kinase [Steroidobacteraceae bacterium]
MSISGPDRWRLLSSYLDRAMDLTGTERADFIATVRSQEPDLVTELLALLDAHDAASAERFLEDSPAPPAGLIVAAGQRLGAYTLISPIGHGGMGVVWIAERVDGRFQRKAAIKFLNMGLIGHGGEQRFKREGSLLARLTHPNIAQLMDAGVTAGGQPYLVIEYVDGEPIDRYCDSRKLGIDERLQLFLDVLAAVADAHAHLIVHRDLKPSNVLVTADGQVKLLDFGIAKLIDDRERTRAETMLTREGGWALTPEFAAPEQVTGGAISTATDVYALSAMLYVLLSGRHPIGVALQSPMEIVKAVVETEPRQMSDVVSLRDDPVAVGEIASLRGTSPERLEKRLKGDLDTVVRKALKKDPTERYKSVQALADDVRRYLRHEPISARPDSAAYRAAKFVRRNRMAVALASMALIAVVTGVLGTLYQARTARAERDYALRQLSRAEAMNDLNRFLLTDAAPSGKPLAVNELLDRAEQIVGRQTAGSAESRAELLLAIGQQYRMIEEVDRARQVLEATYALVRRTTDPSIRARTSCALAQALAKGKDAQRGTELVREGLNELPGDARYTLDRVECLMSGSYVSRETGATSSAIAQAKEAQSLLESSPFRSEIQDLSIFMNIAEANSQAGRYAEAIPAFERAASIMTSLGRDQTQWAGTLFNNWALSLDLAGRPLDAEPLFRRAIVISRADATDEAVSPMLQVNYGRTLSKLGRFDEAARYSEAGCDKGRAAGFDVVVNQALLLRADIYREQGDFGRSAAMLAEVEPRLRKVLAPDHPAFGSLMLERALLARARGDSAAALDLIDRAYVIAETALRTGDAAGFAPRVLARRAELRNAAGRHGEAADDARLALKQLENVVPPGQLTTLRGDAYLALGEALRAMGQDDDARSALRTAVKHLESALGPDHLRVRKARELLVAG